MEAMASTSRKLSAVLCDDEVKECLFGGKSGESLSDPEFDSENELDAIVALMCAQIIVAQFLPIMT
jgi:hypothetical protein